MKSGGFPISVIPVFTVSLYWRWESGSIIVSLCWRWESGSIIDPDSQRQHNDTCTVKTRIPENTNCIQIHTIRLPEI